MHFFTVIKNVIPKNVINDCVLKSKAFTYEEPTN